MTAGAWVLAAVGTLILLRLLVPALVRPRPARDPGPGLPAVSVLVRAGADEPATLAAAVRSITTGRYPWVEVIVLAPGHAADDLARPDVTVLTGVDVDAGVAAAHADVVVGTDGHTAFGPDTLGRLVHPLGDPEVGAVCGAPAVPGGPGYRLRRVDDAVLALDRRGHDALGWLPTTPGTLVAYRKAALTDAAGADPLLSLARTGWRVEYLPDVGATTRPPATAAGHLADHRRYWRRSLRAVRQLRPGAAGGAARRTAGYLVLVWLVTLAAPVADVCAAYGLLTADPVILLGWVALLVAESALLARAVRPAWLLPPYVLARRWLVVLALLCPAHRRRAEEPIRYLT